MVVQKDELKNVVYFSDVYEGDKVKELWKEVWEYIANTYNEDKIKRIYVSGDGAEWIKFGVKYLYNVVYMLYLFHLQKYIKASMKEDKKQRRQKSQSQKTKC